MAISQGTREVPSCQTPRSKPIGQELCVTPVERAANLPSSSLIG